MGNFTAERRDLAFDDESGVGRACCAKPQRLRSNQAVEVIDNKPAYAISGYRVARLILGQQPEIVGAEAHEHRVERVIQMNVPIGVADRSIVPEVAPHTQRYPDSSEDSNISVDRSLDLTAFTDA
jgi:hypothetical protein